MIRPFTRNPGAIGSWTIGTGRVRCVKISHPAESTAPSNHQEE